MDIESYFGPVLKKTPAVVAGLLSGADREVFGIGSAASDSDPGSLVWEIGSITKVFTGVLLAEMSLRGEVDLEDPIGMYLPEDLIERR